MSEYVTKEEKVSVVTPDIIDSAVDSSHDLNELIVNIVTPIISGVVISLVGSIFRKK